MGGKVTAVGMDVITETSGHVSTPLAVSVCTTLAAPSPIPVPYPVAGPAREGIAGSTMRTRIHGVPIGTVGSAIKVCHGNEPGTLKETLSLNTGGACVILAGAPIVLCEQGMMGITGSPLLQNRMTGPAVRSAPAPNLAPGPGMCPAVALLGAGADAGGGSSHGAGDGDGDANGGGGSGADDADGDGKSAPSGQAESCAAGHPVDVVTGRAFTLPIVELALPGPLPLVFARAYSSAAAARDVGLGFGWTHTWGWAIEAHRRKVVVWSDEGIAVDFPALDVGTEAIGAWGWRLRRTAKGYELDTDDGVLRDFAAADERGQRWRLVAITDRNGNAIRLAYDGARLTQVTDSVGRVVRVLATREGRILTLLVRNARARGRWIPFASYAFDAAGHLTHATDADGHVARYAYDAEHRLTREVDRTGLAFHFVYDDAGRCIETWGDTDGAHDLGLAGDVPALLADGTTRAKGIHHCRLTYHPDGFTEVADSTEVRRYFGNHHGLLDKRVEGGAVVTATYDARGFLLARADELGEVTHFERDARGRVRREVDPLGRTTTIERDPHGLPVRITNPAGGVTEIHRDARGNVLHEADPSGSTTSYEYDARGLVVATVAPTGARTTFAYDEDGNVIERVEPDGARWQWTYDALGRRLLETDPAGGVTRFLWSSRGDLCAVHDAEGHVTSYGYDAERRLCDVQGPEGRSLRLTWGHFHKLVAKTNAAGETVRLRYNREGWPVEVWNERGEVHRRTYSPGGLLREERTFDGRHLRYRHDPAGQVTRVEDGLTTTELVYNEVGELLERHLSDGAIERFAYDALGELVGIAWPGGEVTFGRDAAGRIVRERQTLGTEGHAVESTYDKGGARLRRRTSLGHVELVERDARGARRRTILDEQHEIRHERDALGRARVLHLPQVGALRHAYSPTGRVLRRWATSPGARRPLHPDDPAWVREAQPDRVTLDRAYRYDGAHELAHALDRRRGWTRYTYDPAGRLLAVLHDATELVEAFRYDVAGDPYEAGDAAPARTYGPGGRLLRRGDVVYRWDAAGRLREKREHRAEGDAVWIYEWTASGLLAAVDLPDGRRAEFAYDPLGRRLEARLFAAPPIPGARAELCERRRFVWDGDTLVHEVRIVPSAPEAPEVRTFCFEDGSFTPWAQRDDGPDGYGGRRSAWRYLVNDPIGTPEALIDAEGVVLAEIDRRAWGRTEAVSGTRAATPLRFPGQYEDEATGLHYNRWRYYDPDAGLYLSPDPLGLEGGLRAYGYGPNPIRWIDPFGLTTGIVYLRVNRTTGKEYVGRASNQANFKQRQRIHRRKLKKTCPGGSYDFHPLQTGINPGADLAQAEEDWLRAGGGPRALENQIHAVDPKKYKGKVPFP